MRIPIILLACLVTIQVDAQRRKADLLFTTPATHRSSGFLIGLGVTNMFPESDYERNFLAIPESPDAGEYLGKFDPKGRIGLYAEFGMFWLMDQSFFDYVDVSLAYKQQKGSETVEALIQPNALDTLPDLLNGQGNFTQDQATLNVNLHKAIHFKGNWYVLQGLGADVEYRVINDITNDLQHPSLTSTGPSENLSAHFHYRAGVGYKTSASGWLSFTAETPIQNIIPFNGIESRKQVFNSDYRPVVFTIRYQWLRKRPNRECPTGPNKQSLKKKRKSGRGKVKDGQVH